MAGIAGGGDLDELLASALSTGDEATLRGALAAASGLPGPRLDLRLVADFAAVVVQHVVSARPVDALEALLDRWAALSSGDDDPRVVLSCAAVLSYGAVAAARPQWWADELTKLGAAATDARWRVREHVAAALQRMLAADWDRALDSLLRWATDPEPLRVRAAVAAVAEPPLLTDAHRLAGAAAVLGAAIGGLEAVPLARRRESDVRVLRTALGFALSVVAAPAGDFALLQRCAASADADLRWIATSNASKHRLQRWPDQLAALRDQLNG